MATKIPVLTKPTLRPPSILGEFADLEAAVAKEAAELLHYSIFTTVTQARQKQHAAMEAMYNAGIKLYSTKEVVAYMAAMQKQHNTSVYTAAWKHYPVQAYDRRIPIDVLQLAITVKKALPAHTIYVSELVIQARTVDPFMYVDVASRPFYFAKWDEPTFKATSALRKPTDDDVTF